VIVLTKAGIRVQIDQQDLDRLGPRSIYVGSNVYAYFGTWRDGAVTLHSFVMGGSKAGFHIDHINGDKLDNRKANLRFASHQKNQVNRKSKNFNNTSGARGVTVREGTRNPFIAQLYAGGKNVYLGSHATLEAAVRARRSAEIRYFGEECP
jgi:hypothetical protein